MALVQSREIRDPQVLLEALQGDQRLQSPPGLCGNFDISFDHSSRISQLYPTSHVPCAVLYLVPMLIGC